MVLTNYTIDLDQEFLNRTVRRWAAPIQGRRIGTDPSQGYIWWVRDIDSEDADQFGHRLPQRLPRAPQQPEHTETAKY